MASRGKMNELMLAVRLITGRFLIDRCMYYIYHTQATIPVKQKVCFPARNSGFRLSMCAGVPGVS